FFQAEDGIRDFHVTGVQTVLFRSLRELVSRQRAAEEQRCSLLEQLLDVQATRGQAFHGPLVGLRHRCREHQLQWKRRSDGLVDSDRKSVVQGKSVDGGWRSSIRKE